MVVSILSGDEDVHEGGDEESGHGDDEKEMEEIKHEKLSRVVVHSHSPLFRQNTTVTGCRRSRSLSSQSTGGVRMET